MNLALQWILKALTLVPSVVVMIERIHSELPGATKKQLAMDALHGAAGIAGAVLPQDQAAIDAAHELVGNAIDGTVKFLNATGWNNPSPATPLPVPAAAASPTASTADPLPSQPPATAEPAAQSTQVHTGGN